MTKRKNTEEVVTVPLSHIRLCVVVHCVCSMFMHHASYARIYSCIHIDSKLCRRVFLFRYYRCCWWWCFNEYDKKRGRNNSSSRHSSVSACYCIVSYYLYHTHTHTYISVFCIYSQCLRYNVCVRLKCVWYAFGVEIATRIVLVFVWWCWCLNICIYYSFVSVSVPCV